MSDDTAQRRQYQADSDAISVRDVDVEDGDGMFAIRMPVSSTAEARDGDAFSRDRLEGFRDQIGDGDVGVFLDHGRSGLGDSRYSALGKVGYWANPEVSDRDGGADLVADAVLMDPAALDDSVGEVREALATLRAQADLGVPLASSVGWSEDVGEREVPGDADLLEISIVGIPSDPRTTTASAEPATLARAVSAASSDFDLATFERELRRLERDVVEVEGEEIDITPPAAVANACALALSKKEEFSDEIGDCGSGDGEETAQRVVNNDLTAEYIADEIAAYLTSHEEDVAGIDEPPSDWGRETWTDGCGPVQYALWAGTATGTGLDWAQQIANEYAAALGEELPYPERQMTQTHNLDDPEFSEGDAVEWSSNDVTVRGRVADIGAEFSPAEGVTITGDEGEAVYLIHELDDSLEPPQYRRENVAKPESSLDESQADLPPLDGNFADESNSMSDDDTDTEPDAESGADDASNLRGMEEKMDEVREMCERMESMQEEMYEEMMGGDDGEDGEDGEASADEPDAEADADAGDGRTVTVDGEEKDVDDALEEIRSLREEAADAEAAEPKTQDRATDDDDTESSGFGMAARMEE